MKNLVYIAVYIFLLQIQILHAQTTEFTYQGNLNNGSLPASGSHDFEFLLFDALSSGTQIGSPVAANGVVVANGLFSVRLNFGSQFPGANRYLEIRVRPSGQQGFTILSPRQLITSAPYSVKSLNAEQLGGVTASQYVVTSDPRMADARNPVPGNASYIQNTGTQQAASNFNISGNGTAGGTFRGNIVQATTQYNLGGQRILSNGGGGSNLFVGIGAGDSNTTGNVNTFVGQAAGNANSSGANNSFFGALAGRLNTTGIENSFLGAGAGDANTTGRYNSFFGSNAGGSNTIGEANSFFGAYAGVTNTGSYGSFFGYSAGNRNSTADGNSFFGFGAGFSTTTGGSNTFFGAYAGTDNTGGNNNSFFGTGSGWGNTTGVRNTMLGYYADVGSGNLSYATAIGAEAVVSSSNTIQLGRTSGADTVIVSGILRVGDLGNAGSTSLCRNASLAIAICSSSIRYKSNLNPFSTGLGLIQRLRPISFAWKDGGMRDVGLGAEDVAAVEPLLVTYNSKGEVEGVKYDRIGVVLINAVKEQQAQIDGLSEQLAEQRKINQKLQAQLNMLIQRVCKSDPTDEICAKK